MARHKKFPELVKRLDVSERIDRAKSVTKELTFRIELPLALHEANKIIGYSDALSSQIPESYAGHAFRDFTTAMFRYELMQLMSLWERPEDSLDRTAYSIQTVVGLINDPDVLQALKLEQYHYHASSRSLISNFPDDAELREAILASEKISQEALGKEQARLCEKDLNRSIRLAKLTCESDYFEGLKNFRDKVAHSLSETRLEHRKQSPIRVEYGFEKRLLRNTIKLIETFYSWINGVSFSIDTDRRDFAKMCAEELWLNCKFDLPEG